MSRRARIHLTPECSLCLPFRAPGEFGSCQDRRAPTQPPSWGQAHPPASAPEAGQAKPCVGHKDTAEEQVEDGQNEKKVDLTSNESNGCRFKNCSDSSQHVTSSSHKTEVFWSPLALGPCRSRPWAKAEGCRTAVMGG